MSSNPLSRVAGPNTTIDETNSDKGMPSVTDIVLFQREPVNNLAYSRPLIVTSVDSVRQLVSGWLLPDARLDESPSGITFKVDVPFGTAGQSNTWHWPVRGYTGRGDAPGLTPVGSTEVVAEIPADAAPSNAPSVEPQSVPNPVVRIRKHQKG